MRPRATYPLQLGTTRVYLSHDNDEIDWALLAFVAVDEAYAGDYRGAVVVDIGGAQGLLLGAYALGHGARTVGGYEPETENFALLAKAADAKRGEWRTRRSAVGAVRGEAELHVMGASWGHALHPPEAFAKHDKIGVERCASRRLRTFSLVRPTSHAVHA